MSWLSFQMASSFRSIIRGNLSTNHNHPTLRDQWSTDEILVWQSVSKLTKSHLCSLLNWSHKSVNQFTTHLLTAMPDLQDQWLQWSINWSFNQLIVSSIKEAKLIFSLSIPLCQPSSISEQQWNVLPCQGRPWPGCWAAGIGHSRTAALWVSPPLSELLLLAGRRKRKVKRKINQWRF